MAIVNVDLSEYDAIRKRNSELEEQVKELKKLNDSLKQGAKVILRKETVVVERNDQCSHSIFLVIGEDTPEDADFDELDEVTWSKVRVSYKDIEYTRKKYSV